MWGNSIPDKQYFTELAVDIMWKLPCSACTHTFLQKCAVLFSATNQIRPGFFGRDTKEAGTKAVFWIESE